MQTQSHRSKTVGDKMNEVDVGQIFFGYCVTADWVYCADVMMTKYEIKVGDQVVESNEGHARV